MSFFSLYLPVLLYSVIMVRMRVRVRTVLSGMIPTRDYTIYSLSPLIFPFIFVRDTTRVNTVPVWSGVLIKDQVKDSSNSHWTNEQSSTSCFR